MSKNCDVVDFVIANGGIDVEKLQAERKSIIQKMKLKDRTVSIDFFGNHTAEEIRNRLVDKATKQELKFKKILDNKNIRYEFQKIIRKPTGGFYIVDFYLPYNNLIIEIDGKYHEIPNAKYNDDIRTQYLRNIGYKIKRIKNEDINKHYINL